MILWATSDVHVSHAGNRRAVEALPAHPGDWLILAGDLGDRYDEVVWCLEALRPKFDVVVWTPGNHDLWTRPDDSTRLKGAEKYEALVGECRRRDILTPQDPFATWPGHGGLVVAPIFTLYDYSFRPGAAPKHLAIAAATRDGYACADEHYLFPDPFASREEWSADLVTTAEQRLAAIDGRRTVLVTHFPLIEAVARSRQLPLFSIWSGTRRTADWHLRFKAEVVVSGHLHRRRTSWHDGVRFDEVSFGTPRERRLAPGRPLLAEVMRAGTAP